MEEIISVLKFTLTTFGEMFVIIFELIALTLIVLAGLKGIILAFKNADNASILVLKGFSVGLSFLLGGEILRTVIVSHSLEELFLLGGIIVIRVLITVLIHWELNQDRQAHELKDIKNNKATADK